MCERLCGFCKNFPGDGAQCFQTLDIVSHGVRGCDRWMERVEEMDTIKAELPGWMFVQGSAG